MSDIDITLYLNKYRVRALSDALGDQTAETVEDMTVGFLKYCVIPENLPLLKAYLGIENEDDEPYDPYLHIDTYKDFYSRSMFLVNYGKSVKSRVKKDKPTRYRGYASKVSIAAFEIDEYDTIGYWLTPEEYEKLSDKEKQKYSYYEWDEYDDWYRVYNLIVDRVDTMLGYFCRWAEYAIKDANPDETCPTADYVRLLVYRC